MSVLDMTGMSQKNGSVTSHIRISRVRRRFSQRHPERIDRPQHAQDQRHDRQQMARCVEFCLKMNIPAESHTPEPRMVNKAAINSKVVKSSWPRLIRGDAIHRRPVQPACRGFP